MKLGGYYLLGHVAIACKGMTEIMVPKYKKHLHEMLCHVSNLSPMDRLVSGQEFSDITGLKVIRGNKELKPRKVKVIKKEKQITSLI